MNKEIVKKILKLVGLYSLSVLILNKLIMPLYYKTTVTLWNRASIKVVGGVKDMPHQNKMAMIGGYQETHSTEIFVETGTFEDRAVECFLNKFSRLYSIELDQKLAENARRKFEKFAHVQIIQGDSGLALGALLKNINQRCFFWLDGHYSHDITARGDLNTPILKELVVIFDHIIKITLYLLMTPGYSSVVMTIPNWKTLRFSLS
jgi:hypothetical protein